VGRFLLKRLALSLITLWLAVTAVFFIINVLPGNPGRQLLGAQAAESEVVKLNDRLGVNRPLIEQYGSSLKKMVTLDFGRSFVSDKPVTSEVGKALVRSAKLAVLALVITIPLAIWAGIVAARRQGKLLDRSIVMASVATSSIPDFVSATVLSSVFCVTWKLGYVFANPPDGTSFFGQLRYLIFPALAMVLLYFGYIARMTRAGVIDALQSDYTRTATMKGLSSSRVMRRHVLRNALAPTIMVISTQVGYLLGSIIGVELVFNYQGIGLTVRDAVEARNIPMLQGAVLLVALVYVVASLLADMLVAYLNPRIRLGGDAR
jgi:peptide/nickel transport system permease protein